MRTETATVVVEAKLILSARELSLLNHICSYAVESDTYCKGRVSSSYNGGVTKEELDKFVSAMRDTTSNMMGKIEADSAVMFKNGGKG